MTEAETAAAMARGKRPIVDGALQILHGHIGPVRYTSMNDHKSVLAHQQNAKRIAGPFSPLGAWRKILTLTVSRSQLGKKQTSR